MQFTRTVFLLRLFCVSVLIATLLGCGLVDSAGEGVNQEPTVTDPDLTANEQELVILNGNVVVDDDFNNIDSFQWVQTDGEPVELSDTNSPVANFMAPTVSSREVEKLLTFQLTVIDNFGSPGSGTISVRVLPVNDPPVAADDTASVDEGPASVNAGASLAIEVLLNDSDDDDAIDPGGVEVSSEPANGTATVNANGTITYTHNGSETVSDSFQYIVKDEETLASSAATVTVSITPVNDPPIAAADGAMTSEDTPVVVDVLVNDIDVDSTIDPASISITQQSQGVAVASNIGNVSFAPAPDVFGTASFTYTVADIEGDVSNEATVTIDISPIPDAPRAANDAVSTDEEQSISINVLANDIDPDNDIVPSSVTVTSGPSNGSTSVNSDTGSVTYQPAPDFSGSDTFTYSVADSSQLTGTATVTVTVQSVNDGPTISDIPNQSTNEDTALGPISFTVSDADNPANSLTVRATSSNTSLIPNSNLALGGAGTNRTITVNPAANQSGSATISVTVSDGNLTATDNFSVTVNPANDPPDAQNDTTSTDENQPVTISVLANDTDPENDIVPSSVTIISGPTNGSATVNSADGTVTYQPAPDFSGSDTFTYRVADSTQLTDTATVTVTVTVQSNDPPTISAIEDQTINENQSTEPIPFTVSDPDTPLDSLTISATSSNPTLIPDANLILGGADGSRTITVTPAADQFGEAIITITVSDGNGGTATAAFTITVVEGGGLVGVFAVSVSESTACWTTPQARTLIGSLVSSLASSSATYRIVANGEKGTATIVDATTGDFQYVPNSTGERGIDTFTYEIDDPENGITTGTAKVIVESSIMVLGDSISEGVMDGANQLPVAELRTGFRKWLFDALTGLGFKLDFVGTQNAGFGVAEFDADNETHSNWTASEIAFGRLLDGSDGIFTWLETNPADIILLHIGTYGLMSSADQVRLILDEIDRWETSANGNLVTVLLAQIIDQNPINPEVAAFNNSVAEMVQDRINDPADPAFPDRIILVDHHTALDYPADLADTIHPTEVGYGKMADVWRDALITHRMLEKCP